MSMPSEARPPLQHVMGIAPGPPKGAPLRSPDGHHSINSAFGRVIYATLDASFGLLVHGIEIELLAPRLSEKEAVQKGDCNIAIGAALAHYVPAFILIDCAIATVLRVDGRQHRKASQGGTANHVSLR